MDAAGNIFLVYTSSSTKKVQVYNRNGVSVGSIRLQYDPISLAVSPLGRLYVGEIKSTGGGVIEVFDSSTYALLNTVDTPSYPIAMATLTNGDIILLGGYSVARYDSNLTQIAIDPDTGLTTFGGYSSVAGINGKFIEPTSMAVNEAAGQIYVLDKGAVATVSGYTNQNVWRVQVFTVKGAFVRSFSKYGAGTEGLVATPSGIAVDESGRIYLADNSQNCVTIYDEFGTYLQKTISGTTSPLLQPVNLSYSTAGRLAVASPYGKFVAIFGIDAAGMQVTPPSIELTYQAGAPAPSGSVSIDNSGLRALDWLAVSDSAWLSMEALSGSIAAGAGQSVKVTVDPSTFAAGQVYSGNLDFSSNAGSVRVPVSVDVLGPVSLTATAQSFNVTRRVNDPANTIDVGISIQNDLTGSLTWQAASDAAWLGMLQISSSSTVTGKTTRTDSAAQIFLAPDASNTINTPGTHTGNITVSATGAAPLVITVTVDVQSTGKVTVRTNNQDATFSVSGPDGATWSGQGTSLVIDNPAAGIYTATFDKVAGFKTPQAASATLNPGGEIELDGNYVDLRQQVKIIASHGAGPKEPAEIVVLNSDGSPYIGANGTPVDFIAFNTLFGANTSTGDLDGDGVVDIIASTVGKKNQLAYVAGFTINGAAIKGSSFIAGPKNAGVETAIADFNPGDTVREIVAANDNAPNQISLFQYDTISGMVTNTGITVAPYGTNTTGIEIAAADMDDDGIPEVLTAPSAIAAGMLPSINIYKVNISGPWSFVQAGSFTACSSTSRVHIATGDVDADGIPEIIALCSPSAGGNAVIREFRASGELIREFDTGLADFKYLAAGDTNRDGAAEIILGDSESGTGANKIRILTPTGDLITTFSAFRSSKGVKVSVGNVGN